MTSWRTAIAHLASELGAHLRSATHSLAARLADSDPYEIVAYRGYGTRDRVFVHGRALEHEGVTAASEADSRWRNVVNMYKRLESDPLPLAQVRVYLGGAEHEIVADDEGFFRAWLRPESELPPGPLWHSVTLELVWPLRAAQSTVRATQHVLTPPPGAAFGVISDVDDTVIQSRVTNFLGAVRTVILGNARTRLPFSGVAAFYQALQRGAGGAAAMNPIFYVSSSPWNLYDVITEFLELQQIPSGPLLLRDWDLNRSALSSRRHLAHKGKVIREILTTYPTLPFILIGDSGQKDAEIYQAIVGEFPDRILAIYIRDVTRRPERAEAIRKLADEVLAARSMLVLVNDTEAAARHAAEHGWVARDALPAVREEKKADQGETGEKVAAVT
jgi:phosphatidate phosphatase APP1